MAEDHYLLIDNDKIKVYVKGDNFEVGKEVWVANDLLTEAFIGYKTFAGHFKEKEGKLEFYEDIKKQTLEMLDILKEQIDKME